VSCRINAAAEQGGDPQVGCQDRRRRPGQSAAGASMRAARLSRRRTPCTTSASAVRGAPAIRDMRRPATPCDGPDGVRGRG